MIELRLTKGLVLGGMFLITSFFCLLPAWLISAVRTHHLERRSGIFRSGISLLNCFACGVFIGTLFLDLQPDVLELFKSSMPKLGIHTEYPVAQFCIVFGFLIVVTVERVVMSCKREGEANIFHAHEHKETERGRSRSARYDPDMVRAREALQRYAMPNPYHPPNEEEPAHMEHNDFRTRRPSESSIADAGEEPEIVSSVASSRSNSPPRGLPNSPAMEPGLRLVKTRSHRATHTARSFILLGALSLHSVFEGFAVGLQNSREKVVEIFGALLIHKCVVAFSIGMNLMQSRMLLRNVIFCALFFASASPLGIGIAIGMEGSEDSPASSFASAVLQALACGTFLFITFMEVLPHEMLKGTESEPATMTLLKILCVISGFSVMAGLMFMDS